MDDKEQIENVYKDDPEILQQMADEGHILDPKIINTCLNLGIVFKDEFLKDIGIKKLEK
jgi:hypothetical protein